MVCAAFFALVDYGYSSNLILKLVKFVIIRGVNLVLAMQCIYPFKSRVGQHL